MFKVFTLLLGMILSGHAGYAQSNNNHIALLDLDARGISKNESATLTEALRYELIKTGKFTIIERQEMQTILEEQGFQQTGCTSDECAVEIGQLLNVQRICAGTVGKVGSTYSIALRLIDVETGKIENMVIEDCKCPIDDVLTTSLKKAAG